MRVETIGDATLYLGDCMDFLSQFGTGEFSLAVTDPPYFDGPNKTGYYGKGYSSLGVQRAKHYDSLPSWEVPGAEYFTELERVAKDQIIWGANHFCDRFNAAGPGWIVWDKLNGASTFADAELAYCSKDCAGRVCRAGGPAVNSPTTPTAQQVAEALALIPDCDGSTDCYFCAAADLARAQEQARSAVA